MTGEIQKQVRDCRTEPVLYRGLVLTWAGYEETFGGVERIVPSQCGQRSCAPGYTGAKCTELEMDKVLFVTFSFFSSFLTNLFADTTKS